MFRTFAVETNNDVLFVLHVIQYNDDRYFVSLSMPSNRGHGLQQALEQRPYEEANCLYRRCCLHMAHAFLQKDAISVKLLNQQKEMGTVVVSIGTCFHLGLCFQFCCVTLASSHPVHNSAIWLVV